MHFGSPFWSISNWTKYFERLTFYTSMYFVIETFVQNWQNNQPHSKFKFLIFWIIFSEFFLPIHICMTHTHTNTKYGHSICCFMRTLVKWESNKWKSIKQILPSNNANSHPRLIGYTKLYLAHIYWWQSLFYVNK